MRLSNIFWSLLSLLAALACAASLPESNSQLMTRVHISRDVEYTPVSLSNQTIGDYFDSFISENQTTLSERSIRRTQAFTEAVWIDGTKTFNISMSRCVTMSDKAGLYTSKLGNLPNATIQDIVHDLQSREGSEAANRVEYASRVTENAELAIIEANDLLGVAITDYIPITITTDESITHGELRHLLQMPEMVVLITRSSLNTEILVAFFAGLLGRVLGEAGDDIGPTMAAITLFGVQMAIGIHKIVQGVHQVDFVSATVHSIFLAWMRDSMRVFAGEYLREGTPKFLPSVAVSEILKILKEQGGGSFSDGSTWPTAQDLVQKAMGALGYADQPRGRFRAATGFRPGNTCPVPRI